MFLFASLIYGSVVRLRNFLYDRGVLPSHVSSLPSICVGNLAVGGTGKTPHSEFLLRNLPGRKAYVSRGYRRRSHGMVVADSGSTSLDLGDEAYQIHRKFHDVQVVVSANRHEAVDYLRDRGDIDLVILDDAFQHRDIRASFNIILTDYASHPRYERMLPAGRMRDCFSSISRADVVVVTKCPPTLTQDDMERKRQELNVPKLVLFSYMEYGEPYRATDSTPVSLSGEPLFLFTGIEKPEPLANHLRTLTPTVKTLRFNDHHDFAEKDIKRINAESEGCRYIVTTEKDFARLSPTDFFRQLQPRLVVVPIQIGFIGEDNLTSLCRIAVGL
ncbi:MAG: tetraacyldisaccharide 4'-kinase [Paludibacteraceae bacterium]|nr:tetraacyldisaccharide 4'-kinase [Paludibacteraceae bacterium]